MSGQCNISPIRCRAAVLAVLILAVAAACCALSPSRALAWYNEPSTSYPASQDLGAYGAPIYGDALPDGTYQVTARTSSRMCIMYTDPADAEARDSKEQAIVSVKGGRMTAVFYLSKAYTHLYMGTAEQAAAATDEQGADASEYIAGDPDEGYVPHLFSLPVAALNEPFEMAAYSGGDKGVEGGKWYTRQAVFIMTDAEYQAAIGADDPQPDPEPEPDPDPEPESDSSSATDQDTGTTDAADTEGESDDGSDEQEDTDSQVALTEDSVVDSSSDDESGQAGGGADDEGPDGGDGTSGDGAASSQRAQAPAADAGRRGVLMQIAGSDAVIEVKDVQADSQEEVEKPLLTPQRILALALLGLFAAGAIARVVAFSRAYERSEGPPEEPRAPGQGVRKRRGEAL